MFDLNSGLWFCGFLRWDLRAFHVVRKLCMIPKEGELPVRISVGLPGDF